MKQSLTSGTRPVETQYVPPHNEIAQCAEDLWVQYGKPADRDLAIWLEAEQQLLFAKQTSREPKPRSISTLGKRPAKSVHP